MASLIFSTISPALYEALARSLNLGNYLPEDPNTALDHINGSMIKAWIKQAPTQISWENSEALLGRVLPFIKAFPGKFSVAFFSNQNSIKLAGVFGASFHLIDTTFQRIPLINGTPKYIRAAVSAGLSYGVIFAGHHFLEIDFSHREAAEIALRLAIVASVAKVFFVTGSKGLRFTAKSSETLVKVTTFVCEKTANIFDVLSWPNIATVEGSSETVENDSTSKAPTSSRRKKHALASQGATPSAARADSSAQKAEDRNSSSKIKQIVDSDESDGSSDTDSEEIPTSTIKKALQKKADDSDGNKK